MRICAYKIILNVFILMAYNKAFSQSNSMNAIMDSLIHYRVYESGYYSKKMACNLDSAIYSLIEKININEKQIIGYQDPKSSFLAPNPNYIGINALYFLEIIIRDSLNTKFDITDIKLFRKCVLISKKNKFMPLTIDDMNYIKSIYVDWYKATSKLTLIEKRELWKSNYYNKIDQFYEWI